MIMRKPHLCWRCLVLALGVLAGFLTLAHASGKSNEQAPATGYSLPANAGVQDDLPGFDEPASPQIAAASLNLKNPMNMPSIADDSKKDASASYEDSASKAPAEKVN
jgi:hypothetical protein